MKKYQITYHKTCKNGSKHIMRPWLDKITGKYALSTNNKRDNYQFVDENEIIPAMEDNPKLMLRVVSEGQPTSLISLASLSVVETDNI